MPAILRTLRLILLAASLAGGHLAAAEAAVLTVAVPFSVFSSADHQSITEIPFDYSLGTLVSQDFVLSGFVHDTIDTTVDGALYGPVPGTYTVINLILAPTATGNIRLPDTTITTIADGVATSSYSTFTLAVSSTGAITFEFEIHLATPTNPFVPFGGGREYLDGVLNETFVYTPAIVATVPEPSSGGTMLMGLVAAGLCAGYRRRATASAEPDIHAPGPARA